MTASRRLVSEQPQEQFGFVDRFKRLLRSAIAVQMRRWTLNGCIALIRSTPLAQG